MKVIMGVMGQTLSRDEITLLSHRGVSGVVLLGRNCSSLAAMRALIQDIKKINPDVRICLDHEGGRVMRIKDPSVMVPSSLSWDCPPTELCQRQLALKKAWAEPMRILKGVGIDMILGPCVDIHDAEQAVIGKLERSFSANPEVVYGLAMAWLEVCREQGLASCLKHWPGHGKACADSHIDMAYDRRDRDAVMADAQIFVKLFAYADAVMPSHVIYESVCDQPASRSKLWVEMMRSAGFNGPIISDCFSMKGSGDISLKDKLSQAYDAGVTDFMHLHEDPRVLNDALDALYDHIEASNPDRVNLSHMAMR